MMAVSFAALALVVVASLILVAYLPNNNESAPQIEDRGNIFSDDFSETSSGWDQTKEDLFGSYLEQGRYRMYITNGEFGSTRWSLYSAAQVPDETIVEVDATRTGDAPSASSSNWGIVCRGSSGAGSGYLMGISEAGYPTIQRLKDGTLTTLAKKSPYDGYAIQKDGATNHIRGDCVGSKLILYVNDQKVLEASDAELDSGSVGLYVQDAGHKPPGTDVFFDNFLVSEP
jgi:hypothetical protein